EALSAWESLGETCVRQHPCDLAMPERPHCSAMRLQQSCSAAVIAAPGLAHATTGSAASSIARIEMPTLPTSFIVSGEYRFNRSLDAIQLGKLEVTDGRMGVASPSPAESCFSSPAESMV